MLFLKKENNYYLFYLYYSMSKILDSLNIPKQCRLSGVKLWQCPNFLFPIMGGVVIIAIIATYLVAQRYVLEPELVALIVLIVAAILFVIGHVIISSFEYMAAASRTKMEFVSIMSHQLRTPLSNIKWQLDILGEKSIKIDGMEIKDFIKHLEEENQRMIHIVNNLLELCRVDDNALYLRPSPFSFKKTAEETISRYNRLLTDSNSGISIGIKALDSLPDVFADKEKIQTVLGHLLDNALHYNVKGGKILITLEKLPKVIKCSVGDTGLGISRKDLKFIFSKFFRAESAYKYQTQGLGLSLYIADNIIHKSGGKIGVKSEEGKGSTFWFTLPISKNK